MVNACAIVMVVLVFCVLCCDGKPPAEGDHYYHKHNRNNRKGAVGYHSISAPYPTGSKVGHTRDHAIYHMVGSGDLYRRHDGGSYSRRGDDLYHKDVESDFNGGGGSDSALPDGEY